MPEASQPEVRLSMNIKMKILDKCHAWKCYMRYYYNWMSKPKCKMTNGPLIE